MSDMRAFPLYCGPYDNANTGGMTLRDYFAAKAMQGDWAANNPGTVSYHGKAGIEADAARYYAMADAMLKARGNHES